MSIPAPFDRYEGEVLAEWIDANDHMNLAFVTFEGCRDAHCAGSCAARIATG